VSGPVAADSPRLRAARELVLEHGWNATAYQILNPGIDLWFSGAGDAVVGFVERRGVRVVAGAPVCAAERLAEVAAEYEAGAARDGKGVCYFGAGHRLAAVYHGSERHSRVVLGAQPAWNPEDWPYMLAGHASLRQQVSRARNKGIEVTRWPEERARDSEVLHRCLEAWLAGKGLPPLHFLVEPETLSRLYDRWVFVAERGEEVVGFLVATPIPRRDGWLVEQMVRAPDAPNGTNERMIDAAVRAMRDRGSRYVTLGLSPLSGRAGRPGEGAPPWMRLLLGWLRAHVHRFYNFEGLEAFKAKFRPAVWEPIYAISREPRFSPRTLYAVAAAFSDRSVPSTVGRALAAAVRQEARWAGERLNR
jgi:phosphatidylglycerol lysyltransferase